MFLWHTKAQNTALYFYKIFNWTSKLRTPYGQHELRGHLLHSPHSIIRTTWILCLDQIHCIDSTAVISQWCIVIVVTGVVLNQGHTERILLRKQHPTEEMVLWLKLADDMLGIIWFPDWISHQTFQHKNIINVPLPCAFDGILRAFYTSFLSSSIALGLVMLVLWPLHFAQDRLNGCH